MTKLKWVELNSEISGMNEKQVLKLLETEAATAKRASYLTRLHQRYCALRDARERKELLAGKW